MIWEQPGQVGLSHDPSQCLHCSYKQLLVLRQQPSLADHVMRPRTGTNDSAISSDSSHTPNIFPSDHMISGHTPHRVDSGLDEETGRRPHGSVAESLGGVATNDSASSETSHTTIESHVSHKLQNTQQQAVHKEVLSLVIKLSSEVAAKANSQGLNL